VTATTELAPPLLLPEVELARIGIALSGGGRRAALFGLGVLWYVVDTKKHKSVTEISSVSGGSIANALVMTALDDGFSSPDLTADKFLSLVIAPACIAVSHRMGFVRASWAGRLRLLVVLSVLMLTPVLWAWQAVRMVSPGGRLHQGFAVNRQPSVVVLVTLGLFLVVGCIEIMLQQRSSTVCDHLLRPYTKRRLLRPSTLRDLLHPFTKRRATLDHYSDRKVLHVFCATDLSSAAPVYITPRFLYTKLLGKSAKTGGISVREAVAASASFPFLFRPIAKLTATLDFPEERSHLEPGGKGIEFLSLADGGLWNNLGTDFLKRAEFDQLDVEKDGQLHALISNPPTFNIVADASRSAGRTASRGWVLAREFRAIHRSVTMLYENTVAPRREHLRADPKGRWVVVSMAEAHESLMPNLPGAHSIEGAVEDGAPADRANTKSLLRFARNDSTSLLGYPPSFRRASREAVQMVLAGYGAASDALSARSPDFESKPAPQRAVVYDACRQASGRRARGKAPSLTTDTGTIPGLIEN
jgi:predicted acylesterase/phospholipase RssA